MTKAALILISFLTLAAQAQNIVGIDHVIQGRCSAMTSQPDIAQPEVIKKVLLQKLDCLYIIFMEQAGGPHAPLLNNPLFQTVRQNFIRVGGQILQQPEIIALKQQCPGAIGIQAFVTCAKVKNPYRIDDLLIARALDEITKPSVGPPIDPKMTLDDFRLAHEGIFASFPLSR